MSCAPPALLAACGGALAVALAGCGTGSAHTSDLTGQGGALGPATAAYAVLDLTSGQVTTAAAQPDLTDPANVTTRMVFRRVTGLGGDFFIAVLETTQGQWAALVPPSSVAVPPAPWTDVQATVVATATADAQPAYNVSYGDVLGVLALANPRLGGRTLGVPTVAQWQFACRAGTSATWPWGEAHDQATIAAHAVVWESHGSELGPHPAGSCAANALGLHDMIGNVWEWTSPGTAICGGSWSDSVTQATSASASTGLAQGSRHALVGVRFILSP